MTAVVDSCAGDAILSVFGSPEPDPMNYEKAVRAATGMQEKITELSSARQSAGESTCEMGIGVHCGDIVHGFIGMPERMSFTMIGDAVNRAARYCAAAKPGEVLISSALYERVWRIVRNAESATIDNKSEEQLSAYRINDLWQ